MRKIDNINLNDFCRHVSMKNQASGSEVMSGQLTAETVTGGTKRNVIMNVKVYKSNFERYAVLYPDKVHCCPCGYINLKNCCIEPVRNTEKAFRILDRSAEGRTITFVAPSTRELPIWLHSMRGDDTNSLTVKEADTRISGTRSPTIPRSPLMPTLEEESDELDVDEP